MFEDGIKEQTDNKTKSKWALNRRYFLSPINGSLKYHRLGNQERNNPEIPFERASVVLTDVNVTITEVPLSVLHIFCSIFPGEVFLISSRVSRKLTVCSDFFVCLQLSEIHYKLLLHLVSDFFFL